MKTKNRMRMLLVAAFAAGIPASAQAPQHDASLGAYANLYSTLTAVRTISGGKADMVVRVLSAASLQPLPDLDIALQGATLHARLALSPDGFLTVPLDERYLADKTVFVTNQAPGALRVENHFVPVLPPTQLTYGDIAASITGIQRASVAVLPWYARAVTGTVHEIQFCYPDNQHTVAIGDRAGHTRAAAIAQKNALNKKVVYCAGFSDRETAAAGQTAVIPQAGWIALFH